MSVVICRNVWLSLGAVHPIHVPIKLSIFDGVDDFATDGVESFEWSYVIDIVCKDAQVAEGRFELS